MTQNITHPRIIKLYDIAGITPLVDIQDYTEGIYNGNPLVDYNAAQKNQHNYLLDEINTKEGFRLLEIGCGLGTLLETARERGVIGKGITISEDQVKKCRAKGLDVELYNYKKLPEEWKGKFDGIIANGSLEHFCQPEDALNGNQNSIYQEMFRIFSVLLNPNLPHQKVATTAIHFSHNHVYPRKLLRHPFLQIFNTIGFHDAILNRGYGGYYPVKGQLEQCAKNCFTLEKEIDGTEDYRLTSEHWCNQYNKALFHNKKFIKELTKHFLKKPFHTFWTIMSFVGFESWPWQFRGENPPTRLYRQTWKKI